MQDTTLPFDVFMPEEPVLFDIDDLFIRFAQLQDARKARGKQYSLPFILTIAMLAKLSGVDKISQIAAWAHYRKEELSALFHHHHIRIPHRATWYRVLGGAVDPEA
jgi:hypothetical protein